MKNKLSLLMVAALVGNVQAVDSGQNAPLNEFENQLVTAWWKNLDLAQDIRRIKELKTAKKDIQNFNLPLQTITGFVDPVLGTVKPGMLQQLLKPINFAFEEHDATTDEGNCQLPVAFMKKGDKVVAAYISDTRTPNVPFPQASTYDLHVSTLIENLRNQHGANLPILVNTPHRNPGFFGVTGTLYSSAKEFSFFCGVTGTVYSSAKESEVAGCRDLTMHGGTGGAVKVMAHNGDLRTNAHRVNIVNPINLNLTCDDKEAFIDIQLETGVHPDDDTRIVTLNDHQGKVMAFGDTLTLKMKNHSGSVTIDDKAKAIIENAEIDFLTLDRDGDALIVNGKIRDLRFGDGGGTPWLVDSTVHSSQTYGATKSDIYKINTGGDLSKAPGRLEEILKYKAGGNENKQKMMNAFNALLNQCQMPYKHISEEHQE